MSLPIFYIQVTIAILSPIFEPVIIPILIFREVFQKHDFNWNSTDGTVKYKQDTIYFFDSERSNGTLEDKITILNPVMVVRNYILLFYRLVQWLAGKERSVRPVERKVSEKGWARK